MWLQHKVPANAISYRLQLQQGSPTHVRHATVARGCCLLFLSAASAHSVMLHAVSLGKGVHPDIQNKVEAAENKLIVLEAWFGALHGCCNTQPEGILCASKFL